MIIDDITSLRRDTFVYKALIQEFSRRSGKNASRYVAKKVCANFAEDSCHIPILKYSSRTVWGTGPFGADALVEIKSLLKKDIQLDEMLERMQSQDRMSFYTIEELVDPVIFAEWLFIYSKLKPYQIAWLATHRGRRHTYKCVSCDWTLWGFHIHRIFGKLLNNPHLTDSFDNDLKIFIEREIDEAAKDARQALGKILKRDVARYQVMQWMDILLKKYPLAAQIKQTIEPPFKITPRIILMARIRRCFTTILRLHLTNLRLASDKREIKRPMESYLVRLKNLLTQLGNDGEQWANVVEKALQNGTSQYILRELYKLFKRISVIENFDCWFDDKQLMLNQWLTK